MKTINGSAKIKTFNKIGRSACLSEIITNESVDVSTKTDEYVGLKDYIDSMFDKFKDNIFEKIEGLENNLSKKSEANESRYLKLKNTEETRRVMTSFNEFNENLEHSYKPDTRTPRTPRTPKIPIPKKTGVSPEAVRPCCSFNDGLSRKCFNI
ncbi:hypothetical protein CI610_02153 [invertebrate metagenome]|uniref:Uncharacterized protein n=1 Tax=invertebrate metagenome TaxID=1711999 RepID=A0A2H9T6M4_9ZZZZ